MSINPGEIDIDKFLAQVEVVVLEQAGLSSELTKFIERQMFEGKLDTLVPTSERTNFLKSLTLGMISISSAEYYDENDPVYTFHFESDHPCLSVAEPVSPQMLWVSGTLKLGPQSISIEGGD